MSDTERPAVLLVDDNDATCTLVATILKGLYRVDVAGDGEQAVERLKTARYAAILLDLKMPHYDGYDVLEFLRQKDPQVLPRVLVFTAALTERDLKRVGEYPICGIVRKPFDVDDLLAEVKKCVRGKVSRSPGRPSASQ
jgi:CheY-like chemotaxis protein